MFGMDNTDRENISSCIYKKVSGEDNIHVWHFIVRLTDYYLSVNNKIILLEEQVTTRI